MGSEPEGTDEDRDNELKRTWRYTEHARVENCPGEITALFISDQLGKLKRREVIINDTDD